MRISASEQVATWLSGLAPSTKRRVRLALRGLANEQGDIEALHPPLDGFYRLRVGGYRVVFTHQPRNEIRLEYADMRDVVYERFRERLGG